MLRQDKVTKDEEIEFEGRKEGREEKNESTWGPRGTRACEETRGTVFSVARVKVRE